MIISERIPVTDRFAQEVQMQKYVQKCENEYKKVLAGSWAGSAGPILQIPNVKSGETNLGNMIADLVRTEFDADIAILAAAQIS